MLGFGDVWRIQSFYLLPVLAMSANKTNIQTPARFVLIVFALVLSLPAIASYFTDHQLRSRQENRALTKRPSWSQFVSANSQSARRQMSRHFADHIGFALPINHLYRRFLFYVVGESPDKRITRTGDNYVFLNNHNTEGFGAIESTCRQLSEHAKRVIQYNLDHFLSSLQGRSDRMIIGVFPTKANLYPQHLPKGVATSAVDGCKAGNVRAYAEAWREITTRHGAHLHYPLDEFLEYGSEEHFYPKHFFHANGLSTSVFASSLFANTGISVTRDFRAGGSLTTEASDLSMYIGFPAPGEMWQFPYAEQQIQKDDISKLAIELKVDSSISKFVLSRYTTKNPLTQRRAVILSNSYGLFAARDLATGYRSLTHININMLPRGGFHSLFSSSLFEHKPDDIVVIVHDAVMTSPTVFSTVLAEK
jgi:hypothetical protein